MNMPTRRPGEHICAYPRRVQWTPQEIRTRRAAKGLDQSQLGELLAQELGEDKPISRRAITNWENGHAVPRGKYLNALDKILGDDTASETTTLSNASFMQLLAELAKRYSAIASASGHPHEPDPSIGNWAWRKADSPSARRQAAEQDPGPQVDPSEQHM